MALAITLLTSGTGTGTTPDTASISVSAGDLILVCEWNRSGGADKNPDSMAGAGLTFDMHIAQDPSSGSRQMSLWRAESAGTNSGAISIEFGAVSQSAVSWLVVKVTGQETGANGDNAIAQEAGATATAGALDVPLAAFADAVNNVAFGFFGIRATLETMNVDDVTPGYTKLGEVQDSNDGTIMAEYLDGEDTTVRGDWTSSVDCGGIAIELIAAAGGGGGDALDLPPIAPRRSSYFRETMD